MPPTFEPYLSRWGLTPDGDPIVTPSSDLLPVRQGETKAMLKLPRVDEERLGGLLMSYWNGDGAAFVLAEHEGVLLLERATGPASLAQMAENGSDDEAARIVCAVAARLHAPRPNPPRSLVPLETWFREIEPAAARHGGILIESAKAARELLAQPQDIAVLHGDLHHGNVLDFSPRGWLAIDPKGLVGERGFDFANLFCNPTERLVADPKRLSRLATVISEASNLDRQRLLKWVIAYAGLSAAWTLEDGGHPALALTVAQLAYAEGRRL
jgi:streptomycin 6-kinase